MRHSLLFASPLAAILLGSLAFLPGASVGCSSDDNSVAGNDAGDASTADADFGDDDAGDASYPTDDAQVIACTLHTSMTDPVALCTQKIILTAWKANTRTATGIATGWDSTTGAMNMDGGAPDHDFHDDLGYGSAIADYHRASNCYGDNQITETLDNDLADIQPLMLSELSPLPAEYRGDTYFRLRNIAAGLRYINETSKANATDAVAEAYGSALASSYFVDLGPANSSGGATDAGASDAGDAGDAAVTDASAGNTTDAGDAGIAFEDGIIGTPTGGAATYRTADSAMAALALLDLASRHTGDNAAGATVLEAAADGTLYHLYNRAVDASGLYFTQLSTSTVGAHDTSSDTSGTFSTDVQSQVAFALLDAARIGAANPALVLTHSLPLLVKGEALLAAMNGMPSLYDATNVGYYAAITPSTGAIDNTKTTLSNAYMLEATRDDLTDETSTDTFLSQIAPLRTILAGTTQGMGFLGLVTHQEGYTTATTASFAQIGTGDLVYSSAAIASALMGLNHELPADCSE